MVDIPPTIMALARVPVEAESFDGRSFAKVVAPAFLSGGGGPAAAAAAAAAAAWPRQEYLVAYMACSQSPKISPNDHGHAKDVGNNTFIGLRIINTTTNLAYYEFTDAYKDWAFKAVEFYELYDLVSDAHQLHNLYYQEPAPSVAMKQELHERLHRAWACRGATCF